MSLGGTAGHDQFVTERASAGVHTLKQWMRGIAHDVQEFG